MSLMKCFCAGDPLKANQMVRSSENFATKDCSVSGYSSQTVDSEQRIDTGNIEEAETSLREGVCLNYEEARALLGRLEYQRGNVEAALRVFDGIDIAAIVPKMKISLAKRTERHKLRSHWDTPLMSIHAVSLLIEAVYLKARVLQDLGRFKGQLNEAKGLFKEAVGAYAEALDIDPEHVPSLVSTAIVLRRCNHRPLVVVRSYLTDALKLDRTNYMAWFNLGLLYKDEGGTSIAEAAECFQAAALLEESAPVEPFRWPRREFTL